MSERELEDAIERVLLRRLHRQGVAGYTREIADEIASASRSAILEEAAEVADAAAAAVRAEYPSNDISASVGIGMAVDIAAAIRSLSHKEKGDE
jgi:hypothetical protein